MKSNKFSVLIAVVSTFAICMAVFYWVGFKSNLLANNDLVIYFRRWVYLDLYPKIGRDRTNLPFDIIATHKITAKDDVIYTYMIVGRLQYVDTAKKVLFLTTNSGETYGVNYFGDPTDGLMYKKVVNGLVNTRYYGLIPILSGVNISIQWTDSRMLNTILDDASSFSDKLLNPYMSDYDYMSILVLE